MLIAYFSMFLDHIGIVFFPTIQIFRIIGRLSFPLFAWGIARGYKNTRNFEKYVIRILLLALLSQIPYTMLFNSYEPNICFSLLIGLIILRLYDSNYSLYIKVLSIILLLFISEYFDFQYGIYGIITIFIFYYFWNKESVIYYQSILTLISIFVYRYDPIQLFASFSPFLILLLNKYDFKLNRFLQYSLYPLHLLILFFLKNGGIL